MHYGSRIFTTGNSMTLVKLFNFPMLFSTLYNEGNKYLIHTVAVRSQIGKTCMVLRITHKKSDHSIINVSYYNFSIIKALNTCISLNFHQINGLSHNVNLYTKRWKYCGDYFCLPDFFVFIL